MTVRTYDVTTQDDFAWSTTSNYKLTGFGRAQQFTRLNVEGQGAVSFGWKADSTRSESLTFKTGRGDSFTVNYSASHPSFEGSAISELRGALVPDQGTGRFAGAKGRIHVSTTDIGAGSPPPPHIQRMHFTLTLLRPTKDRH